MRVGFTGRTCLEVDFDHLLNTFLKIIIYNNFFLSEFNGSLQLREQSYTNLEHPD